MARRTFWRVISDLASAGTTIMVTTHYMDEAEYCHRLGIMKDGRIVAVGSPDELRNTHQAATMEEVFLSVAGTGEGAS